MEAVVHVDGSEQAHGPGDITMEDDGLVNGEDGADPGSTNPEK